MIHTQFLNRYEVRGSNSFTITFVTHREKVLRWRAEVGFSLGNAIPVPVQPVPTISVPNPSFDLKIPALVPK